MNAKPQLKADQTSPGLLSSDLQQTIDLFSNLSDRLSDTYQQLESQVSALQSELQESDREREREQAEKARLALRFERVMEILPAAVVMLNGSGRVISANRAASALLGEPLENERWIDIIDRCFQPNPMDGHEVALKNGRLVSLATQSLDDTPGQIIVLSDLTETRLLQTKLNHHQKLSEMGKMTASLAHQVRTPLSTALLYADHLSNEKLPADRQTRYAGKLKAQLQHLQQQINDMLIFSKQGILIEDELSVEQLIELLHERFDTVLANSEIQFQVANALDLHGASERRFKCNKELLVSAFGNLLDNGIQALKSSSESDLDNIEPPTLTLDISAPNAGILSLTVSDNGPGISATDLAQVQQPFFTTKSTGTGLGLAVVNAVINAHGGQFTLNNRVEGGVSAQIQLPCRAVQGPVVGEMRNECA